MKTTNTLIIVLVFALAFLNNGCGKKRTTGDINVNLTVLQGETVNMTGIDVQLHGTALFDNVLFHQEATGSATSGNAQFEELEPGKYYVCAWLDKDSDLKYSTGDIFGFYSYPVEIAAKDEKDVNIEVYILD